MGTLHIRKSRRGQHDAGNITLFLGCVILKQNHGVSYKCSKLKPTKTIVYKNIELLKMLSFFKPDNELFSNKDFSKTNISIDKLI